MHVLRSCWIGLVLALSRLNVAAHELCIGFRQHALVCLREILIWADMGTRTPCAGAEPARLKELLARLEVYRATSVVSTVAHPNPDGGRCPGNAVAAKGGVSTPTSPAGCVAGGLLPPMSCGTQLPCTAVPEASFGTHPYFRCFAASRGAVIGSAVVTIVVLAAWTAETCSLQSLIL